MNEELNAKEALIAMQWEALLEEEEFDECLELIGLTPNFEWIEK